MATVTTPQPIPLKAGDMVVLRSSPKTPMTILTVDSTKANCTWYNPVTGKFDKNDFPLVCIRKYAHPAT